MKKYFLFFIFLSISEIFSQEERFQISTIAFTMLKIYSMRQMILKITGIRDGLKKVLGMKKYIRKKLKIFQV